MPVRVANIGSDDIWLNPKMRLGTGQCAVIVKETGDDVECDVDIQNNEIHVRIERMETRVQDSEVTSDLSDLPFKVDIGDVQLMVVRKQSLVSYFTSIVIALSR